jgi:hypothetical protein
VFACAALSPGWCRAGRGAEATLAALAAAARWEIQDKQETQQA